MITGDFELVDQLKEYDDFFEAYGELIVVDGVRLARLGDCTVEYYDGYYDIQRPFNRLRHFGKMVTWKFFDELNFFLYDRQQPLGGMFVGLVVMEDRRVFGRLDCQNIIIIITEPSGVRLICEHLMGKETPLLDWLIDNVDVVREFVSQTG